MSKEKWMPVVGGGRNYAVSDSGRLFSFVSGRYLKSSRSNCGYETFGSTLGSVHRLVVKAFMGEIPEGLQVNHMDGVKHNNNLSNLEVVTASQNQRHAIDTGLSLPPTGEKNGMSVLVESEILEMYDMFLAGHSNTVIGDRFGVHSRYVSLVRHGKRWKHLYSSFGKKFPTSHAYPTDNEVVIKAYLLLKDGMTNIEVSKRTGIEVSMVSRIKTGKSHKNLIDYYNSTLATTIETHQSD